MSLYKQFFSHLKEGVVKTTNKGKKRKALRTGSEPVAVRKVTRRDLDEISDELANRYIKAAQADIAANPTNKKRIAKRRTGLARAVGIKHRNDRKRNPGGFGGAIPGYYNDPKEPRPYTGD